MLGPTIGPHEYYAAVVGLAAGFFTANATTFVKKLGMLHEPETQIIFYLVLVGAICGSSEHSSPAASIPGVLRAPYTFWDFVSVQPAVNSV